MLSAKSPSFLSGSSHLPTDHDIEKLACAVRMTAGEMNLSRRTVDRYQAWILGFISWCLRTDPYEIARDRINGFREAIERHPEASQEEVYEAMDALGFLYGALSEPEELLSFASPSGSELRLQRPRERPLRVDSVSGTSRSESDEDIPTLTIGWKEVGDAAHYDDR